MSTNHEVKYAYNTLVYANERIEDGIRRLAKYGYDGVEFIGEPEELDVSVITEELKRNNIEASSICSIYTTDRDLVSSNPEKRSNAIEYVKGNVIFASKIGAKVVTVTPTACMKTHPEVSIEQEWEWAAEAIREIGKFALDFEVNLVLEPWNRYETYLINRLEQSMKMVDEVDLPNVGSMCDTFHMNIEEDDISTAIQNAKGYLKHIHIADSSRKAPGRGHIDFRAVANAIKSIGYKGYLSMELLPAAADPFMVLNSGRQEEFYDQYTRESVEFLRPLFE